MGSSCKATEIVFHNNETSDKQGHFYLKNQMTCKAYLRKFNLHLPAVSELQAIAVLRNATNNLVLETIKTF